MWLADRQAVENPGIEVHIMVDDAEAARQAITAHGGTLVWQSGAGEAEAWGTFRDPDGNLLGYYQHSAG